MKSNILLFCLITSLFSYSVPDSLREEAKWVNDKLIRCEFNAARTYADSLLVKDSTEPLYYYLKLAALGLESLDRDRVVRKNEFNNTYNKGISLLIKNPKLKSDSYLMMLKGFMESSLSSFNLISGNYIKAMNVGQNGLKSVEKARELDSSNNDVDYYLGFFSYARGELKKRVPILFWLENSSKEGIKELEKCSKKGLFMNSAADMVLVDVLVREGELSKGSLFLDKMLKEYPGSRFLLWTKTRLEVARGQKIKASDTFLALSRSYIKDDFIHNALVTSLESLKLQNGNKKRQREIALEIRSLLNGKTIANADKGSYNKLNKYCKE